MAPKLQNQALIARRSPDSIGRHLLLALACRTSGLHCGMTGGMRLLLSMLPLREPVFCVWLFGAQQAISSLESADEERNSRRNGIGWRKFKFSSLSASEKRQDAASGAHRQAASVRFFLSIEEQTFNALFVQPKQSPLIPAALGAERAEARGEERAEEREKESI